MMGAEITANPLKLDARSHWKCLAMCFVATISTFQYGTCLAWHEGRAVIVADCQLGLDYALVGGFLSYAPGPCTCSAT